MPPKAPQDLIADVSLSDDESEELPRGRRLDKGKGKAKPINICDLPPDLLADIFILLKKPRHTEIEMPGQVPIPVCEWQMPKLSNQCALRFVCQLFKQVATPQLFYNFVYHLQPPKFNSHYDRGRQVTRPPINPEVAIKLHEPVAVGLMKKYGADVVSIQAKIPLGAPIHMLDSLARVIANIPAQHLVNLLLFFETSGLNVPKLPKDAFDLLGQALVQYHSHSLARFDIKQEAAPHSGDKQRSLFQDWAAPSFLQHLPALRALKLDKVVPHRKIKIFAPIGLTHFGLNMYPVGPVAGYDEVWRFPLDGPLPRLHTLSLSGFSLNVVPFIEHLIRHIPTLEYLEMSVYLPLNPIKMTMDEPLHCFKGFNMPSLKTIVLTWLSGHHHHHFNRLADLLIGASWQLRALELYSPPYTPWELLHNRLVVRQDTLRVAFLRAESDPTDARMYSFFYETSRYSWQIRVYDVYPNDSILDGPQPLANGYRPKMYHYHRCPLYY